MQQNYQICKRCIMDTSDPDISFDENGFCNHCTRVIKYINNNYMDSSKNRNNLEHIINLVKASKLKTGYDCVIGLSGGVDSSYLAYKLVREFNIQPLAVHVDNGWNSEISVSNIDKIVTNLNIDLTTYVIDWEEFKELQLAFLKASVVDLEMLSDHAIAVIINQIAIKNKIKYFLIGSNYQTESFLPKSWFYSDKIDSKNIHSIYKRYGNAVKIETYPLLNIMEYISFGSKYGKYLMPLSLMDYNKTEAKNILIKEIGWEDYGGKHHESFITRFYQSYILPTKFNIDKRRAHFSSLICAGQLSRATALNFIDKPPYDIKNIENDIEYFCKKMGIDRIEFNKIITSPRNEHSQFDSYYHISNKINRYWEKIKKIIK